MTATVTIIRVFFEKVRDIHMVVRPTGGRTIRHRMMILGLNRKPPAARLRP